MNRIQIEGFVGNDAETVMLKSGGMVVKFSVATTSSRKDKASGEWIDSTEWHNVVMFGKMAERYDQHIKKGFLVSVEGKQMHRTFQKEDGTKGYSHSIMCSKYNQMVNMPKNPKNLAEGQLAGKQPNVDVDSDLPF